SVAFLIHTTSVPPAFYCDLFCSLARHPPHPSLFPYTTLFRSSLQQIGAAAATGGPPVTMLGHTGAGAGCHHGRRRGDIESVGAGDRKSTRLNSSHVKISYAVFCLNKKSTIHPAASRDTHSFIY